MLYKVWEFLKNPIYRPDPNTDLGHKKHVFIQLLKLNIIFSIASGIFTALLVFGLDMDLGQHAAQKAFEDFSLSKLLFLVVILAPIIEEFAFRAPLALFANPRYFKYAYYISILLFGFVHIFNFERIPPVWIIPLLVLPQLFSGIFLGFIRVKLALKWSIMLHAAHNFVLFLPLLLLNVPKMIHP